jgi:hypothetical protein
MAPIFFGFKPRTRGASKLVVKTSVGELEPVEPSRFRVYVSAMYSPIFAMVTGLLGLAVAIYSYPAGFFVPSATPGLLVRPAKDDYLPFKAPGLAVIVAKGKSISTDNASKLESSGFHTMMMSGRTLWLKERAERGDYIFCASLSEVDTTGVVPGRYLSINSFKNFLLLRSITTKICELFHLFALTGSPYKYSLQSERAKPKEDAWINAAASPDADKPMVTNPFEFAKIHAFNPDSLADASVSEILKVIGSTAGTAIGNSSALVSPAITRPLGMLRVSDQGAGIPSGGLLFKFEPQLASPDVNYIGDVLGRRFIQCLGDSSDEQFELLSELKSGLSSLQLTRVGDELAHLYRCLDIAIDCHAGCIPIFDGLRYEGAYIGGGPGATIFHNGATSSYQSVETLKQDYLMFSTHSSNLAAILKLLPQEETEEGEIVEVTGMVELRRRCLSADLSQAKREEIVRRAAHLDFGLEPWVINPSRIRDCCTLISNLSFLLNWVHPIGRLSLFSTDPVLVALSCFGEKTCPSWDIPNGTPCSLKKANPPVPPASVSKKGSTGSISDAGWVMVVRQTTLPASVEEFRSMATSLQYRSSSSVLARKVGHRVFTRDKMGEFWNQLRYALRSVNPNAALESEDVVSEKRLGENEPVGPSGKKKRRMDV